MNRERQEAASDKDVRLHSREGDPAGFELDRDWRHLGECGDLYVDGVLTRRAPGRVFAGLELPNEVRRLRETWEKVQKEKGPER